MGRLQNLWRQITGANYRELKALHEAVCEDLFNMRWIQCEDLKHQNEALSNRVAQLGNAAQTDMHAFKNSLITALTAYTQLQAEKIGWQLPYEHLFTLPALWLLIATVLLMLFVGKIFNKVSLPMAPFFAACSLLLLLIF